jgi:SAM-dependent methyltransferase
LALKAHDRNKAITSARFAYHRCVACGTVFLIDVPADLSRYYAAGYHGWGDDDEPPSHSDPFLKRVEAYRVELLCRYVESGALIEIGAGTGGFAAASREAGFDVTAIEMDERCCQYLADRVGVRVIRSDRPVDAMRSLPAARVVAMWHSLEHLQNPAEVLAAAAARVEPGGVMAIGTPNVRSLQFRVLGSRWAHLDAPRHLCLIPAPALIERASEFGFRLLTLTTADPFGQHSNVHGWSYGLMERPSAHPERTHSRRGRAVTRLMRPIERRGENGSALLLVLRKESREK